MPTYEYKCTNDKCGELTTESRNVDDRDLELVCKKCDNSMIRVYNSVGIHFKGTGFYSTGG